MIEWLIADFAGWQTSWLNNDVVVIRVLRLLIDYIAVEHLATNKCASATGAKKYTVKSCILDDNR
jgi:hypothetical protein